MPCTSCLRRGLACKLVSDHSNRYYNYVNANVVCNGDGVTYFLVKNIRRGKRLENEEAEAEAALEAAIARLARVRKQKRLLKARVDKAFARRLRSQEKSGELQVESIAVTEAQSLRLN
ncbi:hypothetical protein FALCPG4_015674 [Fusarium falciforme]